MSQVILARIVEASVVSCPAFVISGTEPPTFSPQFLAALVLLPVAKFLSRTVYLLTLMLSCSHRYTLDNANAAAEEKAEWFLKGDLSVDHYCSKISFSWTEEIWKNYNQIYLELFKSQYQRSCNCLLRWFLWGDEVFQRIDVVSQIRLMKFHSQNTGIEDGSSHFHVLLKTNTRSCIDLSWLIEKKRRWKC